MDESEGKKEGKIAVLLLNRPERFNSFDLDLIEQFANHLISLAVDNVA
ncbi:MAG: hypothetical protein KIH08_02730 [Candidatus Freyarchaeota archaeon]|nr:hypothetical protein [Candidatus Jordarchaeia archaeon]MBS7267229.1 hypothetical protein [Candidatus Jordarchaeia archaeon]MBS7278446.1 hypothetical protein [Candidatus Jordarchaeia archaeon]